MDELRAALAIARKDIRNVSRYRFSVASSIFTPLYQGVLPGLLFGASFAVGGKVVGLDKTIGTADLAGFIFMGGVISGLVATAFWAMAMSLRNEMEMGTLEPTWLTPTARETLVIGRAPDDVRDGHPQAAGPRDTAPFRPGARIRRAPRWDRRALPDRSLGVPSRRPPDPPARHHQPVLGPKRLRRSGRRSSSRRTPP